MNDEGEAEGVGQLTASGRIMLPYSVPFVQVKDHPLPSTLLSSEDRTGVEGKEERGDWLGVARWYTPE